MKKTKQISFLHWLASVIGASMIVAFGDNPSALEKKAKVTVDHWVKTVYRGWVATQQFGPGREKLGDQIEECGGTVVLLDVDSDGDLDAVVELFSMLVSGTSFRNDLAVFINERGTFSYHSFESFGGKFDRMFAIDSSITMTSQGLRVPFAYWETDEGGFYPTHFSVTYFTVREANPPFFPVGRLEEELPPDSPYKKNEE